MSPAWQPPCCPLVVRVRALGPSTPLPTAVPIPARAPGSPHAPGGGLFCSPETWEPGFRPRWHSIQTGTRRPKRLLERACTAGQLWGCWPRAFAKGPGNLSVCPLPCTRQPGSPASPTWAVPGPQGVSQAAHPRPEATTWLQDYRRAASWSELAGNCQQAEGPVGTLSTLLTCQCLKGPGRPGGVAKAGEGETEDLRPPPTPRAPLHRLGSDQDSGKAAFFSGGFQSPWEEARCRLPQDCAPPAAGCPRPWP